MEITFSQKLNRIKELCAVQGSTDPVAIAKTLMQDPLISIHGPEHHILDGAAFLTALHNAGVSFDFDAAFEELRQRGKKCPAPSAASGVSAVLPHPSGLPLQFCTIPAPFPIMTITKII